MSDYRSFLEGLDSGECVLSPFESHHLVKVNRARQGDRVVCFDGKGRESEAELLCADARKALVRIGEVREHPEPKNRVVVLQALPKGKTFESEIRRLTELGVWEIVPVISARSEHLPKGDRWESREERWRASAVEGAKQSGNPWIPRIFPVVRWEELMGAVPGWQGEHFIASLASGSRPAGEVFGCGSEQEGSTGGEGGAIRVRHLLVGPEGDFTPEETEEALAVGFRPVSLGIYVQRVETAAISFTALASQW